MNTNGQGEIAAKELQAETIRLEKPRMNTNDTNTLGASQKF